MGETRTKDDKFKATFGYITDHALTARKDEVRQKVAADLAIALANVPASTSDATKKVHQDKIDGLKAEVQEGVLGGQEKKAAYKTCESVDKRAAKIQKAIDAIEVSERLMPKLKGLEPNKLDEMVKKVGDKAKSAKEQGFMIAAIRARYDIDEMSGELTSSALPRFYKVLGMVPEEHARLNDSLKKIHREKESGSSTAADGQMTINAGLANKDNTTEKFNDSEGKKLKLNDFDQTTLHEIGHTVDEAYDFMASKREDIAFGGWKESSFEEVSGLIAAELKKSLKDEGLTDDQLAWLAESGPKGVGKSGIDPLF
jgi:hypothetical protein